MYVENGIRCVSQYNLLSMRLRLGYINWSLRNQIWTHQYS